MPGKINKKGKEESSPITATQFVKGMNSLAKSGADNSRYFRGDASATKFLNVRMGDVFALAKKFTSMPVEEIEKLFDSDYYEVRLGAVCIMDFLARNKKITPEQRKSLFELYIDNHHRIDNWDMIDRSAPYVVGGYLADKPRAILYKLAKSKNVWERRTAIVSTYYFIRQNEIDDTFKIAELLVRDKEDMVSKAVGSWVREAGKRDRERLLSFLDKYAGTMARDTLRYATEKLDKKTKDFYLKR
ncbi:DNA alkylation repair protein [Cytophagales bacterium WSM2-2]|nr:DNA alkylation repair protein [Cytophagales bacterium WSM2-2]